MSGTTGTTCFVTGAGGFVGMHFVRTALAAGFHVVALLHHPTEEPDENRSRTLFRQRRRLLSLPHSHRRLTITEGTLHDRAGLRAVFDQFEIDAVVHLAGVTRIPEAKIDAAAAFAVNVEGTRRLAEEAERRANARGRPMHFVFSSTICVFEGVSLEPAVRMPGARRWPKRPWKAARGSRSPSPTFPISSASVRVPPSSRSGCTTR
jgi:UDP-glucose 4-epimerase